MKLPNSRIVIDDRERKSGIPELIKKIGINVEIKTLQVGDYIVSPETVVERKSIQDFMSSILSLIHKPFFVTTARYLPSLA